jgi:DNA replication protein DnaD
MQGFISLHRKLMNNPIWGDPNYLKLWVYCLFKATHQEHEQLVGNQMVKLQRGQFITGRNALAEDLNRGVKPKQQLDNLTWFRYLKNLETWGMLNIKTTNKFSVVTIDKYEFYQDVFNKVEQGSEHQMNSKRTSNEHQMNTNNNVNKGNNVNKKNKYADFVSLTLEEYQKLLEEFGEQGTADRIEKLNLYKGSTGKKYKSDYLTILNWERKNKSNKKEIRKENFNLND